jgi:hypothetical protein
MGKRQRKRNRGTTESAPRPKRRLGQTGPFMVCRECDEVLNLYSVVDPENEWEEERIVYLHPLEYVVARDGVLAVVGDARYDHEAVPVPASPVDVDTICDFCHRPSPRWVFVPRRPIRMSDPETGGHRDYSSAWNCCAGCLQAVKSRNMTKMLDRAMTSPYGHASQVPELTRSVVRASIRFLYDRYLKSDPAGPYELKIRAERKL